jgi:hypothetical protein
MRWAKVGSQPSLQGVSRTASGPVHLSLTRGDLSLVQGSISRVLSTIFSEPLGL